MCSRSSRYRISDFLKKRKDVLLMFNRDITLEEIIEVGVREERKKGKIMAYHEFGMPVKEIAVRRSVSRQYVQSVLENECCLLLHLCNVSEEYKKMNQR